MVRQRFRLGFDDLGELRLQLDAMTGVYLLSPALEEALIGGVLDERMLERIGRLGRDTASKYEFGLFKLLQDALEPGIS